ncbi:hypothetical protein BX070DRAFT_232816 [Coemansia spiralis]|nr:hypothetical protein BX070DRAFT_232816 [Coemansia spiralis]
MLRFRFITLALAATMLLLCVANGNSQNSDSSNSPDMATAQPTGSSNGKCPPPNSCYKDVIKPECKPGKPCPQFLISVVACTWTCGNDKVPAKCTQRCKPCKAEICAAICECEIVCPQAGPCTA